MVSMTKEKALKEINRRTDGRIEWICEHGIGHTIWFPKGSDDLHGCDGCCTKNKFKIELIKKVLGLKNKK